MGCYAAIKMFLKELNDVETASFKIVYSVCSWICNNNYYDKH